MWLTLNIHEQRWRDFISMSILRLAIVEATLIRIDWGEVINSILAFSQRAVLLVPLVVSFGVSIAAAAQGHCTTFHWWIRGIHWHEGKLWSVWWKTKGIVSLLGLQFPPNVSSFYHIATPSDKTNNSVWIPQSWSKSHRSTCQSSSEMPTFVQIVLELKETKLTLDI